MDRYNADALMLNLVRKSRMKNTSWTAGVSKIWFLSWIFYSTASTVRRVPWHWHPRVSILPDSAALLTGGTWQNQKYIWQSHTRQRALQRFCKKLFVKLWWCLCSPQLLHPKKRRGSIEESLVDEAEHFPSVGTISGQIDQPEMGSAPPPPISATPVETGKGLAWWLHPQHPLPSDSAWVHPSPISSYRLDWPPRRGPERTCKGGYSFA